MPKIPNGAILLGYIGDKALYLTPRDRSMHVLLIGTTGTGKTTTLELALQQDLRAGRGLCLIDPMGALYDRLVRYCCYLRATGRLNRDVILFDPSRGEWILPFNPFIRRDGDLSVQVDRRVQATLRAWGQRSGDETPRLEKWLKALFTVLIECNLTIIEAQYLLDQHADRVRQHILAGLTNPFIRAKFQQLCAYKPSDFAEQIESVENRLMRFLTSDTLRRTMGTGEHALDFSAIMDQGKILLVNLKPSNFLSREPQRLIGTLLLTEFFEAAIMRSSGARPFYCYVDEAALFVSPELGEAFEQCRQKGLHLTLAFQTLAQFKDEDERVYKSIKNNARNKLVFAIPDRADASELADDLVTGLADPEIKLVKHRLNHLIQDTRDTSTSRSCGQSRGAGESETETHTRGQTSACGLTRGSNRSHSEQASVTVGSSVADSESEEDSTGESFTEGYHHDHAFGSSETISAQHAKSRTDATIRSYSAGSGSSRSESGSNARTLGSDDYSLTRSGSHSETETRNISEVEGRSCAYSASDTFGRAATRSTQETSGTSSSHGLTTSHSHGRSRTLTSSEARQSGTTGTAGISESEAFSETESQSQSSARSRSRQSGTSESTSITDQPGARHIPFLEEDPQYWTLEEQRFRAAEMLMHQKVGNWYAGTMQASGRGHSPLPEKFYLAPDQLLRLQRNLSAQFCLSPVRADELLQEREKRLLTQAQQDSDADTTSVDSKPKASKIVRSTSVWDHIK